MLRIKKLLNMLSIIFLFLILFFVYLKIKDISRMAYSNTQSILTEYNIRKNTFYESNEKKGVK